MRVYPNPDKKVNGEPIKVRDPEHGGEFMPAEGRHVPRNTYWLRRVTARDVLEGVPPVDPPEPEVDDEGTEEPTEQPEPDTQFDTPEAQTAADDANSQGDNAVSLPHTTASDGGQIEGAQAKPEPAKKQGRRSRKKSEG